MTSAAEHRPDQANLEPLRTKTYRGFKQHMKVHFHTFCVQKQTRQGLLSGPTSRAYDAPVLLRTALWKLGTKNFTCRICPRMCPPTRAARPAPR